MTEAVAASKYAKLSMLLYVIYAVLMVLQFMPMLMIPTMLALMVAVIIAYANRGDAKNTPYESHFHFLIRTFWIGGGVFLPVMTVLASLAAVAVIDFSEVKSAVQAAALEQHPDGMSDKDVVVQTVMLSVMQKSGKQIENIVFFFSLPVVFWWIRRCWQGYHLAKAGKPVENVMRWT